MDKVMRSRCDNSRGIGDHEGGVINLSSDLASNLQGSEHVVCPSDMTFCWNGEQGTERNAVIRKHAQSLRNRSGEQRGPFPEHASKSWSARIHPMRRRLFR